MRIERRPIPDQLHLVPLIDERVERYGYGPLSEYVELNWLPVLGPTATLLYRRLGSWVVSQPEGLDVDSTELAASFGLGESLGAGSKLGGGIARLAMFGATEWQDETLAVRRALPSVEWHRRSA